jgi:type II secretion system protein N
MLQFMKNTRKWLPYLLFFIAVTAFFMYHLFPSNFVKNYLTHKLNKIYPDINITIDYIKPAFSPGLRLHNVAFYHQNNSLFVADQIKIAPGLLSLLSQKSTYFLKIRTGGGTIKGKGQVLKNEPAHPVMIEAKISGIQAKDIPAIEQLTGRKISGMLDGNFVYSKDKQAGENLNAKFIISDCEIKLSTPVFMFESATFSKIEVDLAMKNRKLQVKQCIIKGSQVDGFISGTITLKKPSAKSVLNLAGTIKPHQAFLEKLGKDLPVNLLPKKIFDENGFPIRLYGRLDKPGFSFN